MEDQNMHSADAPEADRSHDYAEPDAQAEPGTPEEGASENPRKDDRNVEIPESPAPDPEEGSRPGGEDDPQAD